jgi:hypothetical protein
MSITGENIGIWALHLLRLLVERKGLVLWEREVAANN